VGAKPNTARIEPGCDVVVFGCGRNIGDPGSKIAAGWIIAVDQFNPAGDGARSALPIPSTCVADRRQGNQEHDHGRGVDTLEAVE
jgi:hypothetical protein